MIRDDSKGKSLLKEPPVFDGDKKKYREWRQKLSRWLKDPKNRVKDDDEKINITQSYIEGDKVSDFVQNIYDCYWFDADKEWRCSYNTLMKKLNERFLEASRHEDAREAFDRIKMMPGECAETFFEHFEVTACNSSRSWACFT